MSFQNRLVLTHLLWRDDVGIQSFDVVVVVSPVAVVAAHVVASTVVVVVSPFVVAAFIVVASPVVVVASPVLFPLLLLL